MQNIVHHTNNAMIIKIVCYWWCICVLYVYKYRSQESEIEYHVALPNKVNCHGLLVYVYCIVHKLEFHHYIWMPGSVLMPWKHRNVFHIRIVKALDLFICIFVSNWVTSINCNRQISTNILYDSLSNSVAHIITLYQRT